MELQTAKPVFLKIKLKLQQQSCWIKSNPVLSTRLLWNSEHCNASLPDPIVNPVFSEIAVLPIYSNGFMIIPRKKRF
jgi:hypothetical protein